MVTPNKQAILEKAKELWVKDQIRNGCSELAELNPEYKELLESGYIYAAQQELMRSTDGYAEYIEREYAEVNNKTKVEFAKLKMQSFAVDVVNACGTSQTGKTTLTMRICERLMENTIVV